MPTLTESLDYIEKVIKSCETEDQLTNCVNMVDNLTNRSENKENKEIILAHFEIKISNKLKTL